MALSEEKKEYSNFVGGKWVKSETGETFETVNPANTKQQVGRFQLSGADDSISAVHEAQKAFPAWKNMPPPQRGKVLYKAADIMESELEDISKTLTTEEGKTLAESRGEVQRAIDIFRFFAGQGSRLNGSTVPSATSRTFLYTTRGPVGVVALMTPWNFPIAIPAWKIAPALICGNSVVFKPASLTPLTAIKLVSALERAGLPTGVLNFVTGPGGTVGEELATNPGVDAISFTGSYEVGYGIQRARSNSKKMARGQLQMGGKNPTVVLPDAKLDEAVDLVVRSGFGLTGQACTATSRVIIQDSVKQDFSRKLSERAAKVRVADGLKPDTQMGPAVSKPEFEKDLDYIEVGKSEGAKILVGGKKSDLEENANGYFVEPTVFDDVYPDMRIAREEIFGPVLSLMAAKNLDEAVELANNSEFGLTAGICTSNLSNALEFAERVEAGVIKINRPTTGLELQVPFGGFKKSSSDTFKEQGQEAVEFYSRIKTVYVGY